MQFDKIPVDRIKRAKIRYYEKNKGGCEIPEIDAYSLFMKVHDIYINLVHPFEECNVYERLPYSNTTLDNEDHGTMLRLVNGKDEDGICYVLESKDDLFNNKTSVSIEEVEREIIYNSKVFYFDRWELAFGDRKDCTGLLERLYIKKVDSLKREKFLKYLEFKKMVTDKENYIRSNDSYKKYIK